jgi:hypothetical protein
MLPVDILTEGLKYYNWVQVFLGFSSISRIFKSLCYFYMWNKVSNRVFSSFLFWYLNIVHSTFSNSHNVKDILKTGIDGRSLSAILDLLFKVNRV